MYSFARNTVQRANDPPPPLLSHSCNVKVSEEKGLFHIKASPILIFFLSRGPFLHQIQKSSEMVAFHFFFRSGHVRRRLKCLEPRNKNILKDFRGKMRGKICSSQCLRNFQGIPIFKTINNFQIAWSSLLTRSGCPLCDLHTSFQCRIWYSNI